MLRASTPRCSQLSFRFLLLSRSLKCPISDADVQAVAARYLNPEAYALAIAGPEAPEELDAG